MIEKVNLSEAFGTFDETWCPHLVGTVNNMHVRLAKFDGEFVWHHHEDEDEMFLVVAGRLRIELREQEPIRLGPGDFVIVPHGVEHKPVAEEPCEVVLLEPASTLNTGNVTNERTITGLTRIR